MPRLIKPFLFLVLSSVVMLTTACSSQPDDSASPSATQINSASASPSGSATESAPLITSSSFPCSAPQPTALAPNAAEIEKFKEVITSGNTQAMASNSCDTVTLILAGSSCCGPLAKDSALAQWGQMLSPGDSQWNFDVDAQSLALWRTHFYAQYIPEGSLIAVDPIKN